MEQRDYLMKQFEQLGIVLAALLGFKSKGEYKKGLEIVAEGYVGIPGFNPESLDNSDPQEFLNILLLEIPVSFEKLNLIANFVYEEGDFLFLSGDHTKAIDRFQKSLNIFHYLNLTERIYSFERQEKMSRIESILADN